ncbi:Uncharacterized protein FWK35_00023229 [Aphis craccivora]|uniref:Uncharacterized protein n=1 Tax=Aphis craccivora TaxID=307492 RepID=A0A6G0YKR3_APHCR|nr:Uncharacterized protein FWK35_00023229 [Aphis craccivora]
MDILDIFESQKGKEKLAFKNHLVGVKHPSIWTLINKIKNEMSADRAKLALQNVGESKTKFSKSKTAQKRLKTSCERLNSNEIEVDMFLKKISFNLRKRL